jgi:3-deoxy-D-manno-octulosonic-acid transferase
MRPLYDLLANLAGPPLVLAASARGRYGGRWRERLGLARFPQREPGRPRLWFHGASAGEIQAAASVIAAVLAERPAADVYLSSGTPAGLARAADFSAGEPRIRVMAVPLDFWGAAGRAAARLKPEALVILETELWPNLIRAVRAQGAKLILASARLSERSFRRYRLIRPFMAGLLAEFDLIAPSGPRERELFAALGAPEKRLTELGNPKFDRLLSQAGRPDFLALAAGLKTRLWGEAPPGPLVVAGSTHPGEEDFLAEAAEKLWPGQPDLRLVLAPRHVARAPGVAARLRNRGLTAALSEEPGPLFPRAQAVVVETLGQLSAFYALATVAVVGGSLRPGLGGHNPLEPAALARPVLFGPHMPSFAAEAEGLAAAGGARTSRPETLADDLALWLDAPALARAAGQAARDFLAARPAAAPALASAILDLIPEKVARPCPG